MKVTLEPTATIVELDGVQCRVWQGTTEGGHPIDAFIVRVASTPGDLRAHEEVRAALRETEAPSLRWSMPLPPAWALSVDHDDDESEVVSDDDD